MNNEIKEILDRIKNLKRKCNYCLKIGENMYIPRHDKQTDNLIESICLINDMAYYITNLQERNNNLKEDFKRHIDRINELTERSDNLQEENERLKSQINLLEDNRTYLNNTIDKAIKKLESIRAFGLRSGKTLFSTLINESIDTLQGSDK